MVTTQKYNCELLPPSADATIKISLLKVQQQKTSTLTQNPIPT